jgi:sigma-B regulation protein RsbU (phosphoserine phosphatase)
MRMQISTVAGANGNFKLPSTASLVSNLNRQLYASTTPEKYATFYFAVYDEADHSLTYTNAGHLSPLLVRGGQVILLEPTGTVVGAFPFAVYQEKTVTLEHGDMLVAYTDGLVEPENAYGEMYGEERLTELLLKYHLADSSEIIARAMEAVVQWTGSTELQDDMTMVVARRI